MYIIFAHDRIITRDGQYLILYSLFTDLLVFSAYKRLKQETHFNVDFLRQAIEAVTILHNNIMLYSTID